MGPRLLTKTLQSYKSKGVASNCSIESSDCTTLLPRRNFYPVHWDHAGMILNTSISEEMSEMLLEEAYTLHAPRRRGLNPHAPRFGTT